MDLSTGTKFSQKETHTFQAMLHNEIRKSPFQIYVISYGRELNPRHCLFYCHIGVRQ
jgi:hypothetical protein